MALQEFIINLYNILNRTRKINIASITVSDRILIELVDGSKFEIVVNETDEVI